MFKIWRACWLITSAIVVLGAVVLDAHELGWSFVAVHVGVGALTTTAIYVIERSNRPAS